ncbi:DNA-directed RNA polymerase III subunit RPC11 [Nematocida homosporus]|uniref:DNA-directed RNA polymerase III subunit RPC11 n=1 Tax=Nematocida homosporus TaxID=1912981 RepID=UPI00221EE811|nr:DNA-directed RNA polymerase III subunit RPC11 [Nematocida homosporus]KAI5185718.1 DNA-directed RNA polymerase III subunit RPC11 [Nematocida homosporus]
MAFCNRCFNSLSIEICNGNTRFTCDECKYHQEIKGIYRVKVPLTPRSEEMAVKPRELPERAVICPQCSEGKAYFYQMQTRSADEPMTIFNTCVACKYAWRE